jgi:hypothetical protein
MYMEPNEPGIHTDKTLKGEPMRTVEGKPRITTKSDRHAEAMAEQIVKTRQDMEKKRKEEGDKWKERAKQMRQMQKERGNNLH